MHISILHRFSPFLVMEKMFIRFYIFIPLSILRALLVQITLFFYPSISTRYREKRRGKRRERRVEREAVLFLRSFSNRIESNLVAFRRVEKRSGVRFFLVRFSARVENTRKSIEVVVFPVERREFFSQSRTIATPFPT